MATTSEFNYSSNKLGLIQSGSTTYDFPGQDGIVGDDITLAVYGYTLGGATPTYLEQFSYLNADFNLISDYYNTYHIKPNDLFNEMGYASGDYQLTFNFTRNIFNDLQSDTYCPEGSWDVNAKNCENTTNYSNVVTGLINPFFWRDVSYIVT